jgi:hypothetical protein
MTTGNPLKPKRLLDVWGWLLSGESRCRARGFTVRRRAMRIGYRFGDVDADGAEIRARAMALVVCIRAFSSMCLAPRAFGVAVGSTAGAQVAATGRAAGSSRA